jgi:hypothetical protein
MGINMLRRNTALRAGAIQTKVRGELKSKLKIIPG